VDAALRSANEIPCLCTKSVVLTVTREFMRCLSRLGLFLLTLRSGKLTKFIHCGEKKQCRMDANTLHASRSRIYICAALRVGMQYLLRGCRISGAPVKCQIKQQSTLCTSPAPAPPRASPSPASPVTRAPRCAAALLSAAVGSRLSTPSVVYGARSSSSGNARHVRRRVPCAPSGSCAARAPLGARVR